MPEEYRIYREPQLKAPTTANKPRITPVTREDDSCGGKISPEKENEQTKNPDTDQQGIRKLNK